ncbi:MAG: kdpE [Glaciihabitans sp.]|nr:kdpE [Glaciihabitans sp.]
MKVVIVDDDPRILRALRITLGARGYDVFTAANGTDALAMVEQESPDVVMLDLGLPNLTGIEVIQRLRTWTTVPILVVSGRSESWDKVEALDAGADDYVTKPFAADELLARLRALTRRAPAAAGEEAIVAFGTVTIDLGAHRVLRDGSVVRLTPTEWRLLEVLVRNAEHLVTREQLLTEVWGPQYTTDTGYLRLYVGQLRKKLEPVPSQPRHFLTESGMGYRFSAGV